MYGSRPKASLFPVHLSVGAVVLNEKNQVLCHHFPSITLNGENFTDLYILIRETLESGETLDDAIHRGLQEEAGVKAKITAYLGSLVSWFPGKNNITPVEKTTLYFLCSLESIDEGQRKQDDPESQSELLFLAPDVLIKKIRDQTAHIKRTDLNETDILEKIKKYIQIK